MELLLWIVEKEKKKSDLIKILENHHYEIKEHPLKAIVTTGGGTQP